MINKPVSMVMFDHCVCELISLEQKGRVVSLSVTLLFDTESERVERELFTHSNANKHTHLFLLFVIPCNVCVIAILFMLELQLTSIFIRVETTKRTSLNVKFFSNNCDEQIIFLR